MIPRYLFQEKVCFKPREFVLENLFLKIVFRIAGHYIAHTKCDINQIYQLID